MIRNTYCVSAAPRTMYAVHCTAYYCSVVVDTVCCILVQHLKQHSTASRFTTSMYGMHARISIYMYTVYPYTYILYTIIYTRAIV